MRTLKEALISKDKRNWASARKVYTSYKKDKLKTGDLVQLKDGDYMVFMKEKDVDFGKLGYIKSGYYNGDQFIGDNTLSFKSSSFIHLQAKDLDDNLQSIDFPNTLSVTRVVPGVIDPKKCKDSEFIHNFLVDTDFEQYFLTN